MIDWSSDKLTCLGMKRAVRTYHMKDPFHNYLLPSSICNADLTTKMRRRSFWSLLAYNALRISLLRLTGHTTWLVSLEEAMC